MSEQNKHLLKSLEHLEQNFCEITEHFQNLDFDEFLHTGAEQARIKYDGIADDAKWSLEEARKSPTESTMNIAMRFNAQLSNEANSLEARFLDNRGLKNLAETCSYYKNQLEAKELELKQAKLDKLTGLPRRDNLEKVYNNMVTRSEEGVIGAITIGVADGRQFKKINDNFGHGIGDKVIRLYGQAVKGNIGKNDFACRYGGEEFVFLIEHKDGKPEGNRNLKWVSPTATEIVRNIEDTVIQTPLYATAEQNGVEVPKRIDIGIVTVDPNLSFQENLDRADRKQYYEKRKAKERDGDIYAEVLKDLPKLPEEDTQQHKEAEFLDYDVQVKNKISNAIQADTPDPS